MRIVNKEVFDRNQEIENTWKVKLFLGHTENLAPALHGPLFLSQQHLKLNK
jgi:hypothetical protein